MNTPSRHPIFLQKINQQSIQHRSNINQKSIKNQWTIDLGSVMRPKTVCFAFLVGLGCVLWATRGQHGRNLGPKMEPKSHKNQCQNGGKKSMRLGWAFYVFWILGANLAPKWRQVGHRKRIVVKFNWKGRKPKKYVFSNRILIIFVFWWSKIGTQIH